MFKERTVSANEQQFLLDAISDGVRIDGRKHDAHRTTKVIFEDQWGVARVRMGATQVISSIQADAVEPYPERPSDGIIQFHVDLTPMASPYFDSKSNSVNSDLTRIIERCIKDTNCVDTETLCIAAKQRVWQLKIEIKVLNYEGNLIDACVLAALASLMYVLRYFRRPDVTVTSEGIKIHSEFEKNLVPLQLNCIPIATTFASFQPEGKGDVLALADPDLLEDLLTESHLTIATTPQQEILCVTSTGSIGVEIEHIMRCSKLALKHCSEIYEHLKDQLKLKLAERKHVIFAPGQERRAISDK